MRTDTERLLQALENLATQLDDEEHGKSVNARHMADMIGEIVTDYRELVGDE
jgi:hypothetical protein